MKTIKAITAALLLTICMVAQAEQDLVVKSNNVIERFETNRRIVLDLTKQNPVVRTAGKSVVFSSDAPIILYMEDDEDAVDKVPENTGTHDTVYDLSGRKVNNPGKGIYIRDGKKVILK